MAFNTLQGILFSMNDNKGHMHPLSQIISEITEAFSKLGFSVVDGPEIEDEYHNFDALNIPENHPARDMWDTFWMRPKTDRKLLRTHTSPVQIRYMKDNKPPIRILSPGKTFRYEATDATHEAQFYQIEGLMIDKGVTMANLKGVLEYFLRELFGSDLEVRFRPSYFPFVEPGVEVDMTCFICKKGEEKNGKTCSVCKGSGWIEILGAGMVHPNVLREMNIDPDVYTGFAFGMGVDRIAMLRYGIDDVRKSYSGDLRFVKQF